MIVKFGRKRLIIVRKLAKIEKNGEKNISYSDVLRQNGFEIGRTKILLILRVKKSVFPIILLT